MKKPENRFNIDVLLPKGRGREPRVAIFADSIATEASKVADVLVRKEEIAGLAKDRKRLGEVTGCDIFLGEAALMALIGKELGPTLAPKGKMPRPVPPNIKLDAFVVASKKSLRIALKENPTIHTAIGNDKMADEDVAANAEAVFNAVKDKLPKGLNNIKSVLIKLTMGKPAKVVMR
jgi:large subunit ribosomal protein L1